MPQTNRWHPVMLPDDYLRKMKRALGEVEAEVEARTRLERVHDDRPEYDFDQSPPDEDPSPWLLPSILQASDRMAPEVALADENHVGAAERRAVVLDSAPRSAIMLEMESECRAGVSYN
jgi:hypothetical protein